MREKEAAISTLIHHISTIIGLSTGICYLLRKSTRRKHNLVKRCMLLLFTILQSWAGLKILSDLADGTSRLKKSYEEIHRLSSSRKEEKRMLWGITFLSSVFKIGFPHLLA